MILTELSIDDLNRLQQFRIERLLLFFAFSLPHCIIQTDSSNTLMIYCPSAAIVDELLDELDDLCNHVWMILGTRAIAIYFCQEEVFCTGTCLR